MHAPVQAIIFDYGKVLSLPPTEAQWNRLASVFSVDQPTFQQLYWGFRDGYDTGEYDARGYWRHIAGRTARTLTDVDIDQLIDWDNDQWTNENHEMLDFARRERRSGKPIAILSNMQRDMLAVMRRKFAWLAEFDVQMYSCEEGIVKPEPKIYLDCCQRLKSKPENTLFLDDKQPNIDGALSAGLQALLFTGDRGAVDRYLHN